MMTEMPNFELGQYTYIIQDAIALGMAMGEAEMSEEDMTAMEEMNTVLEGLMAMDAAGILAGYYTAMGHEMMEGMAVLPPGNVAGEPAECAAARAGVEQFLVAHLVAEAQMMMMMEETKELSRHLGEFFLFTCGLPVYFLTKITPSTWG
jgi:hypothetical protein